MFLYDQLTPERVLISPAVTGREDLFALFSDVLQSSGLVKSAAEVAKRLSEREAILSTGIGGGWAIPHAQVPGVDRLLMAVSVHPQSIEYPSVDNQPVRLVFCLVGDTDSAADHLAGLARLARLARRADALERLVETSTGEQFLAVLRAIEEA